MSLVHYLSSHIHQPQQLQLQRPNIMSEAQFHGWGAFGADSIEGNFKEFDYAPKPFDDDDIESKSPLSLQPLVLMLIP